MPSEDQHLPPPSGDTDGFPSEVQPRARALQEPHQSSTSDEPTRVRHSQEEPLKGFTGEEEPRPRFSQIDLEQPRQPFDQWDAVPPYIIPAPIETSRAPKLLVAALLIVAVAVTGYLVFRPRNDVATIPRAAANEAAAAPAPPAAIGAEPERVVVPPLDESDQAVRELVRMLSSNPAVISWLMTDDLIRNFTTVVSNIAARQGAAKLVPALKPATAFQIEERGEDLFMAPRSYSRYLPLATAASSIDPAGAARLYTTLKPRIDEAYTELGFKDSFDAALERAIILLLETPIPPAPVPLEVKGGTSYRFADPALERLTSSQKLLIRFGPENQRAVQTSLRNIALALGIAEGKLR